MVPPPTEVVGPLKEPYMEPSLQQYISRQAGSIMVLKPSVYCPSKK